MRRALLATLALLLGCIIALGWIMDHLYGVVEPGTPEISAAELWFQWLCDHPDALHLLITDEHATIELAMVADQQLVLPEDLWQTLAQGKVLSLHNEQQSIWLCWRQDTLWQASITKPAEQPAPWALAFTLMFYTILLMLVASWLWPLAQRLLRLRQSAKRFGLGELDERLNVGPVWYIRDLEQEFNHMADRIQQLMADRQLLTGALSHELRTPLAKIRLGLDILEDCDLPDKRSQYFEQLNRDLDQMTELLAQVLKLSRITSSHATHALRRIELVNFIRQRLQAFSSAAIIQCQWPDQGIFVRAHPLYLQWLIDNLLDNANKYGNGKIQLTLIDLGEQLWLSVADNGSGFGDTPEQLLQPFVRAKDTAQPGYGLGLALVSRVVVWLSGRLELGQDQILGGARIDIFLPKSDK